MTRSALLRSWFVEPPISAKWTPLWLLLCVPVAALMRLSINCPDAIGECCTPFFVLVLATAVLLGSWPALAATFVTATVSLFLYSRTAAQPMAMHMSSAGEFIGLLLFLFYCALIIGAVHYTRQTFSHYSRISPRKHPGGVIFSLEDGQAWASWPGNPSPVRLGPEDEVSSMMEDFIAQVELGKHLERRYGNGSGVTKAAAIGSTTT